MSTVLNRYANQDLFIAKNHHQVLGDFVSRSEGDERPFSRQVDAWWAAMTLGVRQGRRTPLPPEVTKFNDGGILSSDPWRITHLELLAIAEAGPEVLERPPEVIRIASEYAHTGFPDLLNHLVGQVEPTLNLMMRLDELAGASGGSTASPNAVG